jgi:hypothetical protein
MDKSTQKSPVSIKLVEIIDSIETGSPEKC